MKRAASKGAGGKLMIAGRLVVSVMLGVGLSATWASAATHTVNPGDSIQAAVDAASPGDTIKVMPGDYIGVPAGSVTAAVHITKPLKLLAKSVLKKGVKVRILPGPGQNQGILVEPANEGDPDIDGLIIKGFTVEGFNNNGIWLRHVKNFKIQGNETINNMENGIWPTLSANGQVKKNVSYGSRDSAMWVEASTNVRVFKNELYDSPTGMEVTVSKDISIKKNDIHHNVVGVGLYHPSAAGLPPLGGDGDWVVSNNYIHDNNAVNLAPPGSMSAGIPTGGGVLVLGVDRVTVEKNRVENNGFFGIGVVDYCLGVADTPFDCDINPPEVETVPDDVLISTNAMWGNGTVPQEGLFDLLRSDLGFFAPAADSVCFQGNYPDTLTEAFLLSTNSCN